ncbi:EAL and HDOD domain-containing protein [Psychrobacillus vulpis]|uniref:HDOD domain-containing protein n=1 Tax=Psychrobacillus vulpis TaxID=2325572 RepID=A0A544TRA8_9BACI|nr:HDOD domain-containing protein [Psychrobacillus vulpis]TQR19984.1 HDOD domain-containing protein [Psychrobacillus vulpis]
MDIFVARQPIFAKNEYIFAYELLYRNDQQNSFPNIDGDSATLEVLIHSFLTIGINELAGDKLCFINFTENLLEKEVFSQFPSNRIVVEILEDIPITHMLLQKLREIKSLGFLIALDDFIFQKNVTLYDELFSLVNFIKVDFLASKLADRQAIERIVKTNYPHIVLLAEKVETRAQFYEAKAAGYELFQGYFFAKPEIIKGTEIPTNIAQYFRIIALLRDNAVSIEEIAEEIERDVSLSFKVLKMINWPAVRTKSKVRSIKQGVVMLGLDELKHWLHVLLLRESITNHSKDGLALIEASLFRAKLCELLAKRKFLHNASEYFLVGMFSLIDTLLHRPMIQLLQDLPLSDEVAETLSGTKTEMTPFLELAIACDEVRWDDMISGATSIGIDHSTLNDFYLEARRWTLQIF